MRSNLKEIMLNPNTPPRRFQAFMRVSRTTFKKLDARLSTTGPYLLRYNRFTGEPIRGVPGRPLRSTRQEEIAIGLYALSSLENYARIAEIWGKSDSNYIVDYVDRFADAVNQIAAEYIKWPRGDRLQRTMDGFKFISGINGVVAVVDGCHVEIIKPHRKEMPGDYNSYKKRYTVILHAAVDCDGLFVNVSVGWPGAMPDSTILQKGNITELVAGTCNPHATDGRTPRFLLADGGYFLRPWLLIAYDYLTTDTYEKALNACVDAGRVVVENAFGRLKGRWR